MRVSQRPDTLPNPRTTQFSIPNIASLEPMLIQLDALLPVTVDQSAADSNYGSHCQVNWYMLYRNVRTRVRLGFQLTYIL